MIHSIPLHGRACTQHTLVYQLRTTDGQVTDYKVDPAPLAISRCTSPPPGASRWPGTRGRGPRGCQRGRGGRASQPCRGVSRPRRRGARPSPGASARRPGPCARAPPPWPSPFRRAWSPRPCPPCPAPRPIPPSPSPWPSSPCPWPSPSPPASCSVSVLQWLPRASGADDWSCGYSSSVDVL
uniref:Uncharacterized protein n=1 Tax=Triticum urartu TaxID=4572 RepID=A0A8R7TM65_TRIUA